MEVARALGVPAKGKIGTMGIPASLEIVLSKPMMLALVGPLNAGSEKTTELATNSGLMVLSERERVAEVVSRVTKILCQESPFEYFLKVPEISASNGEV